MGRIYLSPPDVSAEDRRLLLEALDSGWVAPLGPAVDAFEQDLAEATGRQFACALSSGTAALHLALVMLGVGRGDSVVTSTLTFAATANAIRYVGAEPVFIDSDESSWNMDPDLLEEELESAARAARLPKAVIVVDIYGQCANYERIEALCQRYELPLVEDAAESLGASYRSRKAGSFGDMAALSFNGNKIITTSGGGALVASDERWTQKATFLATQARDPAPHYEHSELGFNYRLSNLLAAFGRGQLADLPRRVEVRRRHNAMYRQALEQPGVCFMPEAPGCVSTFWLSTLTIDPDAVGADAKTVREALAAHDIEARPVCKPMHLQPYYRECRVRNVGVSERLFRTGICLPSGSNLSDSSRERIAGLIASELAK